MLPVGRLYFFLKKLAADQVDNSWPGNNQDYWPTGRLIFDGKESFVNQRLGFGQTGNIICLAF